MIIYKVTNILNSKIYIGLTTKSLSDRKHGHYSDSKRHDYKFSRALKKYSQEDFIWKQIDECKTRDYEDLKEMEVAWINYYDSYNIGYNSTLGGEGTIGIICSEETKKKLSIAKIGENHPQAKLSEANVLEIRKLHSNGSFLVKELVGKFNISTTQIRDIINYKKWKHVK